MESPDASRGILFFFCVKTPGRGWARFPLGITWPSGLGVEGAAGDVEGEALAGEGGEGLLAILLLQASSADRFARSSIGGRRFQGLRFRMIRGCHDRMSAWSTFSSASS